MPNWKKVILSGSIASLNSLTVSNGITGSLFGTASWAANATTAPLYLPLTGGTLSGNLSAAGRTFTFQDLVLGSGTTQGTIKTDGTKYIGIFPTNGTESTRFLANGSVMHGTSFTDAGYRLQVSASGAVSGALYVVGTSVLVGSTRVTGSLGVTGGITGSLFGNATTATSAATASLANGSVNVTQAVIGNTTYITANSTVTTGTTTIHSIPTSSYSSTFIDYVISDTVNSRAGNIQSVWLGSDVNYTETATMDIGNTTDFDWDVIIAGNGIKVNSVIAAGNWSVKINSRQM